jgi:hypothetical protein
MNAYLRIARLATLPLLLGMAACDNPVEVVEHAEGLVVLDASGTEVASYLVDGPVMTGQIVVGVEAPGTFTIEAVSEGGDAITIDGDEFAIEIGAIRPGWTATLSGANRVVITAPAAGEAALSVALLHEGLDELTGTFEVVAQ